MRTYLPTFGILASIAAGCAAGNSTETFGPPDGAADGGATTLKDGTTGNQDVSSIFNGDGSSGGQRDAGKDTGSGGGDTGGPKQTCVHNTDCTGPNLCVGNNGQECLGGFCVPTNMPMNCDDGVPCTTDTCNANTNTCTHTPSNAACPDGELCDPVMNCVSMLPCTPGDGVCDRLDTTVCDGLWSCSAQGFCVQNAPPCPTRANATTTCATTPLDGGVRADAGQTVDGGDIAADCEWTCETGFVDANGDLNAPVSDPSNGCECQDSNPIDLPDLDFTDTNCDGIDGTIADAIFVDTLSGNDNNPGTMAKPKLTIQNGINTAATQASPMGFPSAVKDVYVSMGTYDEHLTMVNGVSVYGGYDAANNWSRALTNTTLVASQTTVGIDAKGLTKPFTLQLLSITAQGASGTSSNGGGASSYGVRIVGCTGGATIAGCTITVSAGAPAPTPAASGGAGANGATGTGASGTSGGNGGASTCGADGGNGAPGVNGVASGIQGGTGQGTGAAIGGGPGAIGKCTAGSAQSGGNGASPVSSGLPGTAGVNGAVGAAVGTFDATGNYLPPFGNPGLTAGVAGGGGGGGGSGGGTATGGSFPDELDCDNVNSGGGGGGGAGGCGGGLGQGGAGGGGSFAVVAISSAVTSTANVYNPGTGGAGGAGGAGGVGGKGGGAGGGANGTTTGDDDNSGGNGAAGTSGGSGGTGGAGTGGAGGPSACLAYNVTSPVSSGDMCNPSGGGTGGAGGSNGTVQAPAGPNGPTGTVDAP